MHNYDDGTEYFSATDIYEGQRTAAGETASMGEMGEGVHSSIDNAVMTQEPTLKNTNNFSEHPAVMMSPQKGGALSVNERMQYYAATPGLSSAPGRDTGIGSAISTTLTN